MFSMARWVIAVCLGFSLISCSLLGRGDRDPNLWLEEVEGEEALKWVEEHNQTTLKKMTAGPRYAQLEKDALQILQATDKIPHISMQGSDLINFWQDDKHVRGLWRRTRLSSYRSRATQWETILDIDKLAEAEKENWVFKGANCLPPKYTRCLVSLSRGGKDAKVVREFDLAKKTFVKDGFYLEEAKSWVDWINQDEVFVGTDMGPETLTESGYPRTLRIWRRGQDLAQSKEIFSGQKTDMVVSGSSLWGPDGSVQVVSRVVDFFTSELSLYKNGQLQPLPTPSSAELQAYFRGYLILQLRKAWKLGDQEYPQGALVAVPVKAAGQKSLSASDVKPLYSPKANESVLGLAVRREGLLLNLLENVQGRIQAINWVKESFAPAQTLPLAEGGRHVRLMASSADKSEFFFNVEDFLNPESLYLYNPSSKRPELLKSLKARFKSQGMEVRQQWATSRDGTKIPYFLVGRSDLMKKGNVPTLLYGYGGFEVSLTPVYNAVVGKLWLEQGGLYVMANIRGGGEFGPKWHQAALKMNRQKAYDDFISVAEHLIQEKVTSPQKLAIQGGSNGGLLVGAVMTQRPDLFKSVLCHVPLLDMLRYSQLLAGASWMAEYGDPRNPQEREYLRSISPYHNVNEEKTYPNLFILTSTKDDRVHPGHARKMAALMEQIGHKNLDYYENTEGGHAATANLKQQARMRALTFEFLYKTIQ